MTDVVEPAPIPLRQGERPPLDGAVKVAVVDDGTQHHHSARTKARKAALDVLYGAELTGRDALETLNATDPPARLLTYELVSGVVTNEQDIDDALTAAFTGDWTLDRMPGIDKALARLAVWELMFTGTPPAAVISEAVALADEYSTDASAGFLTSVLGTVHEHLEARRDEAPND